MNLRKQIRKIIKEELHDNINDQKSMRDTVIRTLTDSASFIDDSLKYLKELQFDGDKIVELSNTSKFLQDIVKELEK